ncbi:hypothetical protein N7462_001477 [Penicillium macrosclerotiorum]|uniref:uncharacterized protein n=1 Tax=Penicillium macrosclerotiorum TaxID=303699 RepID=UPI002547674F|nr:uncharacterized protein N7462_001477 [Penicillium macrosclerotiorum]KAJ5692054.1 hypothetical protein N7462_001477 [Penicillium macrosclerotiorum]
MPALTSETFDLPLAKRQKTTPDQHARDVSRGGSKIFAPFRTLGLVSPTSVPFTSVRLGKSTFQITTSVGHSLQTYDLRKGLNLIFLTRPSTPEVITATHAWQDKVFAAWGYLRPRSPGGIWVFKRGKRVASLEGPALDGPIERLAVFGSWIVGCWAGGIEIWKTGSYEHYASLRPRPISGPAGDQVYSGTMCTMPTYLNKIFVGRVDGGIDIWNLRSGKLLHTFLPPSSASGAVTAMYPTPALSLLAIAHKNGSLFIQNVDSGQLVLSLRTASARASPVTSITFRSDGLGAGHDGRKAGVMATASGGSGDITMWDLNQGGRVAGILRGAHKVSNAESAMGVNRVEFLDGQPVLVSSGDDNALKTWIFDETPFSPTPRPLHVRGGHSAAVSALNFIPAPSDGSDSSGKWLLSASKDCSLWGLSLRKDSQHAELSQGNLERKAKKQGPAGQSNATPVEALRAPEITSIACSLNRDGGMGVTTSGPIWSNPKFGSTDASNATGWESVVTGHRGDKHARTWFWGKKKAGRWAFPTSDDTEVKSVGMSQCGTFALVGSAGGSIDMFNMQSGLHRQSFPSRSPKARSRKTPTVQDSTALDSTSDIKHTKAVTGLMVDNLNRMVISCGLDGKVKFWDLLSGSLIDELDWHPMAAITGLRYSKTSELVAFSCDDLSIRVVDLETRKLVREFWGCVGQVNDFIFSNDGRWIIAASMDSVLRVWDLPTGHLIDIFRVPSTCVSLAVSSTGEFLATAHAGSIGISLWSNRSLFMPISTKNLDEDLIADVGVPTTAGESGAGLVEAAFLDTPELDDAEGPLPATEQLRKDMVTLSLVPKSRWQALLHLDAIRERNRPKEAPKAPKKHHSFSPRFLPSNNATDAGDVGFASLAETAEAERSRIIKAQTGVTGASDSLITRLLASGHRSADFEPLIEHLKSLTPARADLEIRSLDPRVRNGFSELSGFVAALTMRLRQRRDFELVNAWMAVFLKIHADTVGLCSHRDEPEYQLLRDALASWALEQQQEGKRLAGLVGYCRGVVGFLRSAR